MIKVQGKLPRKLTIACSGGADSMAILDFLIRNHEVKVIFCNHGTETSARSQEILVDYLISKGLSIETSYYISNFRNKRPHESQEEYWREFRYSIFKAKKDETVITAHHLDDCVETWLWRSLNGNPGIVPYRNENVIRPFRLNRKRDLELWCHLNNVPYYEDESNKDTKYTRNYIRHELMPHALHVNPGLHKVIKKKVLEDDYEIKQ